MSKATIKAALILFALVLSVAAQPLSFANMSSDSKMPRLDLM